MGAKRRLNGTSKSEHTDTDTNIWTFRLIESIGPEGRCFENIISQKKTFKMWEEKYIPDTSQMSLEDKAGVASVLKRFSERGYVKYTKKIEEIIEKTYYEEGDFKLVKDLKKETEEFTYKYEEAIT